MWETGGVQYHTAPLEAAPGPHDAGGLFDAFCELMATGKVQG